MVSSIEISEKTGNVVSNLGVVSNPSTKIIFQEKYYVPPPSTKSRGMEKLSVGVTLG